VVQAAVAGFGGLVRIYKSIGLWYRYPVSKVVKMFKFPVWFYGLTVGDWGIGLIKKDKKD
jgi:hypothetical protein